MTRRAVRHATATWRGWRQRCSAAASWAACGRAGEGGGTGGFVGGVGDVAFGLGDPAGEHDQEHEPDEQRGEHGQLGGDGSSLVDAWMRFIGRAPG